MRYKSGFAPANMCYDPITATLMVASLAMSGMAAVSAYKNSKNQAKAVVEEGAMKARERAKQTQILAAKQKSSFLNSGISLEGEGTTQNMLDDTYGTGLADINQIKSNYNQTSSNIMGAARAKAMADIGGMVLTVAGGAMASGMFAGSSSATGLAGSGAQAGQLGTGAGAGFSMSAPAGVSRTSFSGGVPFTM